MRQTVPNPSGPAQTAPDASGQTVPNPSGPAQAMPQIPVPAPRAKSQWPSPDGNAPDCAKSQWSSAGGQCPRPPVVQPRWQCPRPCQLSLPCRVQQSHTKHACANYPDPSRGQLLPRLPQVLALCPRILIMRRALHELLRRPKHIYFPTKTFLRKKINVRS